ncbi:hypothetical protein FB45DRAFT_1017204 [Roridomyces roridus]|uniref:Uncharacterized protein n=1 Tax=Roridomyces roridus TaxID=1738132 RepID=A0AAD7FY08_9AGAR|nr:hypothetical protein FB45DRAFT_1017204 [Roridomyces roridus]
MAFISNASGFALSEGTFNNIHGDLVIYQGVKRRREDHEGTESPAADAPDVPEPGEPVRKRRREEGQDGLKIIRNKHLSLAREIGRGPGYLLHASKIKSRAVIVKVFNASSRNARERNGRQRQGHSLRDDLDQSIVLGFKMISDLSSGMDYLSTQGITLPRGPENFDVFLDVNDRFLVSINPPVGTKNKTMRVLRSANRVLYDEGIERTPAVFDSSLSPAISPVAPRDQAIPSDHVEAPSVPPRREFVWRTMDVPQSLVTIATRLARDLDLRRVSINRLARSDGGSIHRCPGYVREEVTLATRTADSAVVSHDAPTVQEPERTRVAPHGQMSLMQDVESHGLWAHFERAYM